MAKKDKSNSNGLRIVIATILVFLSALIIIVTQYKIKTFGNVSINDLSYYLLSGSEGASTGTFLEPVLNNICPFVALFFVLSLPIINFFGKKCLMSIELKLKNKNRKIIINSSRFKYFLVYSIVVFTASLVYGLNSINAYGYVINQINSSSFIADNYVDPSSVKIEFPEQKRNLIFIYLESMEGTLFSSKNGGALSKSLIPELENIASENVSFSNTEKLGGILPAYGASWTVGGMVASSSGVPIIEIPSEKRNEVGKLNNFLPGVYSLGQILEKQSYYQEIMFGSDANFGGRDKYFTEHGNYKISDYKIAIEEGKISKDYHEWWGYEDKKLIEYAKEELTEISKSSQPFNFQLLTADTHFVDGYLDPTCETNFDAKYENVFACSSKRINEFVEWIKQQDFYENTTIIITGDHLGMQTDFYEARINKNYQRTIYNVFINPAIEPTNQKNRQFLSFDIYPSTLASIGAKIDGDALGLGVNLFSDKQTLTEKFGYDYVNAELQKKSTFYRNNLLYKE